MLPCYYFVVFVYVEFQSNKPMMAKFLTIAFIAASIPSVVCSTVDYPPAPHTKYFREAMRFVDEYARLADSLKRLQSKNSKEQSDLESEIEGLFLYLSKKQLFPLNGEFRCHKIDILDKTGFGLLRSYNGKGLKLSI